MPNGKLHDLHSISLMLMERSFLALSQPMKGQLFETMREE